MLFRGGPIRAVVFTLYVLLCRDCNREFERLNPALLIHHEHVDGAGAQPGETGVKNRAPVAVTRGELGDGWIRNLSRVAVDVEGFRVDDEGLLNEEIHLGVLQLIHSDDDRRDDVLAVVFLHRGIRLWAATRAQENGEECGRGGSRDEGGCVFDGHPFSMSGERARGNKRRPPVSLILSSLTHTKRSLSVHNS